MTHSPGPWVNWTDDGGDIWVSADEGHTYHIANMEGSCGTCHANARLIAASPLLLAACEAAAAYLATTVTEWPNETLYLLGKAIAAAKGE